MKTDSSFQKSFACAGSLFAIIGGIVIASGTPALPQEPAAKTLVLAHYMPWYVAKPHSESWGWHWTMNAFDPDTRIDGKPQIASHYRPLIGPYDSGDVAVIEYHLLLMKVAGIDGVIVDWYGLAEEYDYGVLHRNTAALVAGAAKLGLRFAICYEDQTIPKLVAARKLAAVDRVKHARGELDWLRKNWFAERHYVRLANKPLLMSFGHEGLTDQEWVAVLDGTADEVVYVSEHRRRAGASGAFDWPVPSEYPAFLDRFERQASALDPAIPVAFPRFHDIYEQGNAGTSFGLIPDDHGRTWTATLDRALEMKPAVVQLATWNDWGEGTGIEPSEEFAYRDLEALQKRLRGRMDATCVFEADDLRLPRRLLQQRRQEGANARTSVLDEIARRIADGEVRAALSELERLEARGSDVDRIEGAPNQSLQRTASANLVSRRIPATGAAGTAELSWSP